MDHQMKGEYFKMKNHGLRRIFSLFLALFMVFTLLPTTALAEDTTGADETPPKTVVVDEGEKKTDPPAQEQPKNENPPAPEEPKTFTVTYTDGADGAVFADKVYSNLSFGTATPAFSGTPAREGYTFAGWNPAVAETVTADVTYAAKWEEGKTNARRVPLPTIPKPDPAPADLNTGHKIDVRFTVLYVGDEFNIGYNYGSSEKTKFVCQYKTNHSDTAYNNRTIAISDIKAAASRASVNSGYQIVGWSKESNANPTTWSLNKSGTTACNKGSTIYLVAKNPNPTTKYTYTLNYDANGGTGAPSADSWSTTDAAIRYHSFTVKNTIPTREGYVFKGWKANDGSDTIYTGGMTCAVSQYGNDVVKNGNTWTRTLYAVWEKAVPSKPQWSDIRGEMQKVSVHVTCSNPDVNHTEKTYSYKESNDDTIGSVQDSAGSYTCTVTVHLGRYRLQYNQDFNREHEFASSLTADVVLQYNGTGWVIASALPLELKLTCGSAPTPNPPGSDVLNSLKVLVKCDSKTYHFEKPYKMDDGDYRLEKVDDNTYTVIVLADKYVEKYNAVYPGHTLFDNNTKTIKLVYRYGAWTVVGSNGVTFNVSCEQKYTVTYTDGVDGEVIFADQVSYKKSGEKTPAFRGTPTRTGYKFIGWEPAVSGTVTANATYTAQWVSISDLDPAPELVSSLYMNFQCTNENASHDHRSEMIGIGFGIGAGGVIVTDAAGNPVYNKDGNITAVITFYQDSGFLNEYNKRTGVAHRYADYEPKTKSVDGVLIGEVFHMYKKDYPVVFDVVCGSLYTVTYKDGTNGTVFADDVHSNLNANAATPAFVGGTPTRPGYVFTGWNPAVAATVTGNATYTAVWEEDANGNGTPDKDEEKYTVSYTDGVENEEIFADQVYGNLLSGTATPAFNGTPTRAGYKFLGWEPTVAETVTESATYVAQWEKLYTVTYTDGVGGKAFKDDVHSDLEKDTPTPAFSGGTPTRKGFVFDGWNPEVAETVTEDVTYTAQWKPVQPDKKAIEGAIGRGVAVVCDNQNVNHGEKKYKPTLGEYTVSNVMGTAADGYTCTVTVRAAKFIEKYSSDMSDAVHTLIAGEPAEKTIELKWNGEKWVAETELPVTFHTLCPPEQPSKKDIEGAIGRGVKIVCDNQNVNHWGKDYKPTQGEYTVSDVTGTASEGYTCTITVKAAKIIEKYSSDMGKTHALIVGEQAEKAVELKWNGEKWVAKTELPITFHVECPPEKPTYDELKGLGINAKVDCTTTTAHNGKSYTLIEDTYNVSDPERKGTVYTCILTVNAKDYVAKYNAEENVGPHTLDDRDSKTIELTWNGEKWTAAETSVTFNVKCELLTVTYTDGVKGEEVFADVVYKDIPYGTGTPAFGTKDPTRKGYKFVGWEPEVAETVTENVTYTAKWEELYTVTYTDGVKGKAFKDQVYSDLEAGTDTPKFDGKPTRKGYTFTGWSPKVTDTVTKDVTYVAQWKSVKNGKDNIPKTGDSEIVMVLGSVLLFSFCGAAAVSVYDRKRKHF